MSGQLRALIVGIIDVSFLFLLDIFLWREVLHGKNWRNAPVCILIFLLAVGNSIWHWGLSQGANATFGLYFGIAIIATLLSLIGGRVTPSFTRNWLVKSGREPFDASSSTLDKAAIGVLVFSLLLWLLAPRHMMTVAALLFAGALHFLRVGADGAQSPNHSS